MARRNRPGTPELTPQAPLGARRRSARTRTQRPTPELTPPHKYPWENSTVECEVSELVCSFVPGSPHPEGFAGPFQDRFADYLGLKASVCHQIERQKRKRGTVWVLHYRANEGDRWIEKTEVLKDCVTEDEAYLAASRLMRVGPQANVALVHYLSGQAEQNLLSGLSDALEWALAELINYSCDCVKFMKARTPQAMRQGERIAKQQREETVRLLNEQIQNEVDHDKVKAARRALEYVQKQEPFQWKAFPGFRSRDDDSIATCPPVSASDLRDEALERYRERLVRQYDITRGGAYKADNRPRREPTHDWKNEENQRAFYAKVEELRPLWKFVLDYFVRNEYDSGCTRSIKEDSRFNQLSKGCTVPDELLSTVFQRKSTRRSELWPLSFALKHAARELGIHKPDGQPFSVYKLEKHFRAGRPR